MNTQRWMQRCGTFWLALLALFFVAGHMRGGERGLSPLTNQISQYAVSGPWGHLLQVVMIMFGVMLAALGFVLALGAQGSKLRVLAALLLAASCVLVVLTAFHGTYPVVLPSTPDTRDWWTRTADWFRGSRTPDYYEQGRLVAISRVHFTVIQSAIVLIHMAMGAMAVHAWRTRRRLTAIVTGTMLIFAAMMFMAPHWHPWHGLWQRLGFSTLLVWLWLQWRDCAKGNAPPEVATSREPSLEMSSSSVREAS